MIDGFAADVHNVWLTLRRLADGELVRVRLVLHNAEAVVAEAELDAAVTDAGVAVVRIDDELLASRGNARRRVACAGLSRSLRLFGAGGFDLRVRRIAGGEVELALKG